MPIRRYSGVVVFAGAALCLSTGCDQGEVKSYTVPKEAKPAIAAAPSAGKAESQPSLPHVHGDIPAGWEEQAPERMRVASFLIRGDGGRLASMALIPLPGARGIELQSINLWREELGLTQLDAEQYKSEARQIKIGDSTGAFFDMAGTAPRPGEEFKRRTLGAVFERDGMLWFAKLTGEGSLVGEHSDEFQTYLQSLQFHTGAHGETAAVKRPGQPTTSEQPVSANSARVPADSKLPRWNPPRHWQERPPGPMVTAAFAIISESGQGDVTISKLAGEGGGVVANVNRWRGQLGLSQENDDGIRRSVSMIEVDGKKNAYLANLDGINARTGKPARMLAVGVPRDGETWFYKLMGDEALVEKEKGAFVKFVTESY